MSSEHSENVGRFSAHPRHRSFSWGGGGRPTVHRESRLVHRPWYCRLDPRGPGVSSRRVTYTTDVALQGILAPGVRHRPTPLRGRDSTSEGSTDEEGVGLPVSGRVRGSLTSSTDVVRREETSFVEEKRECTRDYWRSEELYQGSWSERVPGMRVMGSGVVNTGKSGTTWDGRGPVRCRQYGGGSVLLTPCPLTDWNPTQVFVPVGSVSRTNKLT